MLKQLKVALLSLILKFLYGSNQKTIYGRDNYLELIKQKKPIIFAVWHGHLLSIVHDLRNLKMHALAGTHPDAELISNIAEFRGWKMIRGSNKEKGQQAYKKMIKLFNTQYDSMLFITPDGPSGPPQIPKLGIIRLAQKCGAAIIPIKVNYSKSWGFKNWDIFYLAKPFRKININYGKPIYFNKNLDDNYCSQHLINALTNEK
tara:strand:- start:23 stop:631 length:609 start_codon:yes stop_codon:yes gene_type:complete